jgi:hypothetical protein
MFRIHLEPITGPELLRRTDRTGWIRSACRMLRSGSSHRECSMLSLLMPLSVLAVSIQFGPTGAGLADAVFAYGALIFLVGFALWDGISDR